MADDPDEVVARALPLVEESFIAAAGPGGPAAAGRQHPEAAAGQGG